MRTEERLLFLDNLRTFLVFLVVLFHAGVVYEMSGSGAPFWIVVDPSTSALPGILNLILDIFIMPTLFFISGFFARASLEKNGSLLFLKTRFRRLMIPWALAVFTLLPLYKVVFLYSRGLPQESWTTYFHFSNGIWGMNWLWFLPALFLFDCLYLVVSKLNLSVDSLTMGSAVVPVFLVGFAYTVVVGAVDWIGWTKTPVVDFQNERLLPYFLVFLLGTLGQRLGIFDSTKKNLKLYIAIVATIWIPMNLYVLVLLNFFLRPGEYIFSRNADGLLLWLGFHLSMLGLVYCLVTTFKYFFNRQGKLGGELGKLSYDVYIVHVIVLGLIALALLETDIPGLLKYPILAFSTWVASNLIAYGYARTVRRLWSRV